MHPGRVEHRAIDAIAYLQGPARRGTHQTCQLELVFCRGAFLVRDGTLAQDLLVELEHLGFVWAVLDAVADGAQVALFAGLFRQEQAGDGLFHMLSCESSL